jgi:putative acetyltransferase
MQPIPLSPSAIDTACAHDLPCLFHVWESSVRATHSFLTDADIQSLIPLVKTELANFDPIYCLRNEEGNPFAFLGVAVFKIEMLFVHAANRGRGAGRLLAEFAIQELHANTVDVNEDNVQALAFYRHIGFRQVSESALDAAGLPFPLLHLALREKMYAVRSRRNGSLE